VSLVHDEYWDEFIPAMLPTRLGSSTDGDPQLAAAWIGWQERRKIDDARLGELQAENARLNMEMVAYREKLTPKDVEAMTAVIKALTDEKAVRSQSDRGAE
jgi:hypothetical protein